MKKTIKIIIIALGCILVIGLISSLFSGRSNSSGTSSPTYKPSTQAPIEDTTEDPKVVELRELVDEIPIFFGTAELMNVNAPGYSVYPSEGVVFNNVDSIDGPIWFFAQRGADLGLTGQYFFMKYRTSVSDDLYVQIYTSTDQIYPTPGYETQLDDELIRDGEWHILAIDLTELITLYPDVDGNYYLKHLRLDVEDPYAGAALELAYLGITDDLNDVVRYVELTESNPSDLLGDLVAVAE